MTSASTGSVLFLGKQADEHCIRALDFVRKNFATVSAHLGEWGDPLPDDAKQWRGDLILSYLSRWVVPSGLIERAGLAALNFHPAPPEYPGIGCNNFALYDEATEYGVTCHHMARRVDTGKIVRVARFPLLASDNVASLLARTYDHQLTLFYDVVGMVLADQTLPESGERWTRQPFTRREFNRLGRITPDMEPDEVRRRVRATSFGRFQPTVEVAGYRFALVP